MDMVVQPTDRGGCHVQSMVQTERQALLGAFDL